MTLPDGWITSRLGDLLEKAQQRIPGATEQIEYIDIGSVDRITKSVTGTQTLIGAKAPSRARRVVRSHDVLVSMTRPNLNAVAVVPMGFDNTFASTGFEVLRSPELDHRWLFYQARTERFIQEMSGLVQGALYPAIRSADIHDYQIELAPFNEQRRIADKLDQTLAIVERALERLRRVPEILKRFRQSVLAAATDGRLTEDWRAEQTARMQPQAESSPCVRDSAEIHYQVTPSLDAPIQFLDGEPGWTITTVGKLITRIEAGLNVKCEERPPEPGEFGLVKISAVTWGEFNDGESKTLPKSKHVPETSRIRAGDFLISRANTLELVGACVIVHEVSRPVFLSDKVLRLVMLDTDKRWLLYVLRSERGRKQIESLASGNQLSMRNLSQANLKSIAVPLPPVEERSEIVRRVEALFALADRIEARHRAALARVDKLTQALLAKAFRGELVPQDPADEPAAALLERIRAARAAAPYSRKRGRAAVATP
jgi:type I restriction enzyme S subunit